MVETPWQKWQREHPGVSLDGWMQAVCAAFTIQDDHQYQENVGLPPAYDGRYGVWF